MQRSKTIEFWNDYHQQERSKEWILLPSKGLLDEIVKQVLRLLLFEDDVAKGRGSGVGGGGAGRERHTCGKSSVQKNSNKADPEASRTEAGMPGGIDCEYNVSSSNSLSMDQQRREPPNGADSESSGESSEESTGPKPQRRRGFSSLRILEIGCGTSTLARELYLYLSNMSSSPSPQSVVSPPHGPSAHDSPRASPRLMKLEDFCVVATDVSPNCISQNMERDRDIIKQSRGKFRYQVLDVIDDEPPLWNEAHNNGDEEHIEDEKSTSTRSTARTKNCRKQTFDVVLDKGCLDTLMFRSQLKHQARLVQKLLSNIITRWLSTNETSCQEDPSGGDHDSDDYNASVSNKEGIYLVLTPRSKIKLLRDCPGFASVERCKLDASVNPHLKTGDLDRNHHRRQQQHQHHPQREQRQQELESQRQRDPRSGNNLTFMYICRKKNATQQNWEEVHNATAPTPTASVKESSCNDVVQKDADLGVCCPGCGMSYKQYLRGEDPIHKGGAYWTRRWKGHRRHCRSPK